MGDMEKAREDLGRAWPGAGRRAFGDNLGMFCQDGPEDEDAEPARQSILFRKSHRRRSDPGLRLQRPGRRHADIGPSGRAIANWERPSSSSRTFDMPVFNLAWPISRKEQGQGPSVLREISPVEASHHPGSGGRSTRSSRSARSRAT
jgi:hypothetical protein